MRTAVGFGGRLGRPGAEGIGTLGKTGDGVETGSPPGGDTGTGTLPGKEAGNAEVVGIMDVITDNPFNELVIVVGRATGTGLTGKLTGGAAGSTAPS